jgi:predicted transposase/invertase (TIGR01784 family)
VLPEAVVARADWSSLRIVAGGFVDRELRDVMSDLICSVRIDGEEAFIDVLVEHQSRADWLMVFRLLRYIVRHWERWLADNPEARRLPAIIPVVLYHDASAWSAPRSLHDLIALEPELLASVAELIPNFRFVLDDLAREPVEALSSRAMSALGRIALICLARARHSPDLLAELRRLATLIDEVLQAPDGAAAFSAIFSYILDVTDTNPDDIEHFAQQLGPKAVEAYMTGAQQIEKQGFDRGLERGLEQGLEQGRATGGAELLIKMLSSFGELPAERLAQVRAASLAELEVWADRILDADSLDEVFDD